MSCLKKIIAMLGLLALMGCGNQHHLAFEPFVSFDTIPAATQRLFVYVEQTSPVVEGKVLPFYVDIKEEALANLKQSKRLALPFVQKGQSYNVTSIYYIENIEPQQATLTLSVGRNGSAFLRHQPALHLNNEQNEVTLSALPTLARTVAYDNSPINYYVSSQIDDNTMVSSSFASSQLVFNFVEAMTTRYQDERLEPLINTSSYVTAYAMVWHNGLLWWLGLADSPPFLLNF